jgi:hypothetical protein
VTPAAAPSHRDKGDEFVADAGRAKLDIDPVGGEEVERLIAELFKLDSAIVTKLKSILR